MEQRDDGLLLRRLEDLLHRFQTRERLETTRFLTPEEQARCLQHLRRAGEGRFRLWGGYEGAERQVLCLIPDWLDTAAWETGDEGPVAAVALDFTGAELSHRDVLGALMAAGLKRETVGDILLSPGQGTLFVLRENLGYVLSNLDRAGRVRLRLEAIPCAQAALPEKKTALERCTVASLRTDCVLAAAWRLSRERAAELLRQGLVQVDHLPAEKGDRLLSEGQTVSARGQGKFRLAEVCGPTKKGRTAIIIERYL